MAAAPQWGTIQYEKLLDRNALLLRDLTVELRAGRSETLSGALSDTARWMLGTLKRPGGGFYLAQAADPSSWLTALEQLVLRNAEAANKPRHDNFSGVAVWIGQPSR